MMREHMIAHLYGLWRWARPLTQRLERQAKDLARAGRLPGWTLHVQERRELVGPAAHALLTERYGAEVADQACVRTASQGALRAVLGAVVPAGTLDRTLREVLEELARRGGIVLMQAESLIRVAR